MGMVRNRRASLFGALLGTLLFLAPADAQASRAFANVVRDEDDYSGPVTFTAARGEKNRLTAARGGLGIVFHDPGSHVRARGQCESLGRHTATCPTSDDIPSISLRERNDRAKLRAGVVAAVHGGLGDDRLTGGLVVEFFGDAGNDVLRGGEELDWLNGGPGRDRLFGGGGDDTLIDGETDAQSAPDVFDGGPDSHGDTVDFSARRKSLRIDLESGRTNTRDTIVGLEDVTGGSGDDRIVGDAAANTLAGGPGRDTLRGGAGNDVPMGGPDNDRVSGDDGDDVVWGDAGTDRLTGGPGNDLLESNEVGEGGAVTAGTPDEVACGDGADSAVSDTSDTLEPACEQLWAAGARLGTVPKLHDNNADFAVECPPPTGAACAGTLTLHSLAGEAYGEVGFDLPPRGTTIVSVPLSAAGITALGAGSIVQIEVRPSGTRPFPMAGGYRMFLRLA